MTPNRSITFKLTNKGMGRLIRAVTKSTMNADEQMASDLLDLSYNLSLFEAKLRELRVDAWKTGYHDGWREGMKDAAKLVDRVKDKETILSARENVRPE